MLSRQPLRAMSAFDGNVEAIAWDPSATVGPFTPWVQRLGQVQAVINLAGENVGGHGPLPRRWTEAHKTRLRASRLLATRALVEGLAVTPAERRPQVLLNASAIGYYGDRGNEVLAEASAPGNDFFANLCLDWEVATLAAEELGLRVVQLRTGVVLAPGAMASDLLVLASRLGAGGPLGSGRQWWSWIHRDDVIGLTQYALHTAAISGPINLVAPNPRQMRDFPVVLGRLLHRPSLLRTPAWALRLAFGELADQLLLVSQRVLPARALQAGYTFRYAHLEEAFAAMLHTPRTAHVAAANVVADGWPPAA